MIKQHDVLAILTWAVSALLAFWLGAQVTRSCGSDDVEISSERLGGVLHIGDRIIDAE